MPPRSAAKNLDSDISFGIQQTLACFATDSFIDPYVGVKIQEALSKHEAPTLGNTWLAEASGDFAALGTFLAMQRFFPQAVQWLKGVAKSIAGDTYKKSSLSTVNVWAKNHHVEKGSDLYNAKLNQIVDEQAEDAAKATVISTGSVIFNVGTQKLWLKSPVELWVVTLSKLSGVLITMAFTLGTRLLAPGFMHKVDKKMDTYLIDPVKHGVQYLYHQGQKLFGHTPAEPTVEASNAQPTPQIAKETLLVEKSARPRNVNHSQRVASQRMLGENVVALGQ